MSNYTVADKTSGSSFAATEHNALKAALNSKMGYEDASTFSAISNSTEPRWIVVDVDETNDSDASLYIHNGTAPRFVMTLNPIP